MIRKFIDRESELKSLEARYASDTLECVIIYGRRRIGKTELIKQFLRDKKAIYHLCDQRGTEKNVERFAEIVAKGAGTPPLRVTSYDVLFKSIVQIYGREERVVVVLDEFPYLVERDDTIPSVFQVIIDEILRDTRVFLILCGSSISMMEQSTLSGKSPLHGRRTGQIKVDFLRFQDVRRFLPRYTFTDQVLAYSIVGGVPAYLNALDPAKTMDENIRDTFLQKDHVFFEEPEQLLRTELREPKQYLNILEAVALGNSRVVNIANSAGMNAKDLPIYLKVLMKLGLVARVTPVTERRATSKHAIYRLQDPFFKFWFRFVQPYKSTLEIGRVEEVLEVILQKLSDHASAAFESICQQFLIDAKPFTPAPLQLGTWWQKDAEIDILGLNPAQGLIVAGECKWQDGVHGPAVLNHLQAVAVHVPWKPPNRQDNYVVFARTFKVKPANSDHVKFIDAEDLRVFYDQLG